MAEYVVLTWKVGDAASWEGKGREWRFGAPNSMLGLQQLNVNILVEMGNKKIKGQTMALSQFSSSLNLLWVWYSCIQPLSPWKFLPSLPRGPCHLSILLIKACSSSPSTEDFNVACISLFYTLLLVASSIPWALMPTTTDPLLRPNYPIFFWRFPAGCFEVILKAAHAKWNSPLMPRPFLPNPVLSGSRIFPGFYCHCLSSQPTSHVGSCWLASLLLGPLWALQPM